MRVCAAQIQAEKGNIESNIQHHLDFLEVAKQQQVDVVLFSELSLTGYEPELAGVSAIALDDQRLEVFQAAADESCMTILVGAPTPGPEGIYISLLIFAPGKERGIYAKRDLHSDEYEYFVEGETFFRLQSEGLNLVPAICYESMLEQNALEAKQAGADIYLASVAKHQDGVIKGNLHYANMAKTHEMIVLMANCIGPSDNFVAYGHSAVWDQKGKRLGGLDEKQQGLIVIDTDTNTASVIDICR